VTSAKKTAIASPPRRKRQASSDILGFASEIDSSFLSIVFPEQKETALGRLLIAAVECFAQNGYHGTSTRDIARHAKLSSAALYVHFKTKNELLYKITLVMARSMFQDLRNVDKPDLPPPERLAALVRSYVGCIARMTTAVRVSTFEFQALTREQQRVTTDLREAVNAIFTSCLEQGQARGQFHIPDVSLMRLAIMSLCITVCQWYKADGRIAPEELADHYADLVLRMVGYGGAGPG